MYKQRVQTKHWHVPYSSVGLSDMILYHWLGGINRVIRLAI